MGSAITLKLLAPSSIQTSNPVTLQITGANPQTVNLNLVDNFEQSFTYRGVNAGTDTIVGTGPGFTSNTVTATWITEPLVLSASPVVGQFFGADGSGVFSTPKTAQPLFSQTFPSIDFDPAAGAVNGNTSVTNTTRPFTEVVTDHLGNFVGPLAAQGNGSQAGVGSLVNFSAVFTGYLNIPAPGLVTFTFSSDDAFIFGMGNGALPVSGPQTNTPRTIRSWAD